MLTVLVLPCVGLAKQGKRLWSPLLLLILPACYHADPVDWGNGGSEDSDTNLDTGHPDTGTETEPETGPVDMTCEGQHLFEYGLESREIYEEGPDGFYLVELWEYEYDVEKRPHTAQVDRYDQTGLVLSYERYYDWGFYDRLGLVAWTVHYEDGAPDLQAQDSYAHEQSQLKYVFSWRGVSSMELESYTERVYGGEGELTAYYSGGTYDTPHTFGESYAYDTSGRLVMRIELDPINKWKPGEDFIDYEYDGYGRVMNTNQFHMPDEGGKAELITYNYFYDGDSGRLTRYSGSNGHESTFEWDEDMLELTILDQNASGTQTMRIHKFTSEGSSRFYEVAPIPPANWPIYIYGNGYINGCIGI